MRRLLLSLAVSAAALTLRADDPPLPTAAAPDAASTAASTSAPASTSASTGSLPRPAAINTPPPTTLDPRITVTKVHEVRNDESYNPRRNDALEFEKSYWSYGAITEEQKEAVRGQIYVISWRNAGPPDRFVTRFEYRQTKTRDRIKVQTLDHPVVNGNVRSIFKVVGADYRQDGPVESWRFTVWRGNKIVGEEKSFIW